MTTCYAQPYAPAAEQKGSSPVSDQQPEGVYVHLLLKYIFLQRNKSGSVRACERATAAACRRSVRTLVSKFISRIAVKTLNGFRDV